MTYTVQQQVGPAMKELTFTNDLSALREELDGFYKIMNNFHIMDVSDILIQLAGFTARTSYLRAQIMRMPDIRAIRAFRTGELDPFLDECDRQFRTWSRVVSVANYEWESSK